MEVERTIKWEHQIEEKRGQRKQEEKRKKEEKIWLEEKVKEEKKGGKKRGGKEGKNLVQQVTGTLVCQSGGRRDVCHASLQPHLKVLKSNIV